MILGLVRELFKGKCFDPSYVVISIKNVFSKHLWVRWVTGSKRNEAWVGKVLNFKPWVGKVKMGQSTGGFTVISPYTYLKALEGYS